MGRIKESPYLYLERGPTPFIRRYQIFIEIHTRQTGFRAVKLKTITRFRRISNNNIVSLRFVVSYDIPDLYIVYRSTL